jgi:preprotein translocase subunit SecE
MAGKVTETNSTSTKMESSRPSGGSRPATTSRNKDGSLIERMQRYIREVIVELKKTTWPTRTELMNSTKVVIGTVVVVGIYLAAVDFALTQISQLVGLMPK